MLNDGITCCIVQPIGYKIRTLFDADKFIAEGYFYGDIEFPDIKIKKCFYALRRRDNGVLYIGRGKYERGMKTRPVAYRKATRMDIYAARTSLNRAMFSR